MGIPKNNSKQWAENHQERRIRRMQSVDEISVEFKPIVHDWGLIVFEALWQCGVRKPNHMSHIIQTIINETRGSQEHHKGSYQA